jgi:putative endonuclease
MASPKQTLGHDAEEKARVYLEAQGLTLLDQNYYSHAGEIDLIMKENDYVVFVEVRSRNHQNYKEALESITPAKQRKVIKTATYYLLEKKWFNKVDVRFDVLVMDNSKIHWIKNAFNAEANS